MKQINIIYLFILLFAFSACEKDEDKMYILSADQVDIPTVTVEGISNIMLNEENINLFPASLNWTRSNFGKDVLVEYILQVADNGQFENALDGLSLGNNVYAKAISGTELHKWAVSYGGIIVDPETEVEEAIEIPLYFRILATPALTSGDVAFPPDTLKSDAFIMNVTPFLGATPEPEKVMYMIGDEFGSWSWESPDLVTMTPVHSHSGHFWCVRYITAGKGFKWNTQLKWEGDFFELDENIGFERPGDGNAYVTESGMYIVYVDTENSKIGIEPAVVSGMGPAFNDDWTPGNYQFEVVDKTMQITALNTVPAGDGAGLRMCATSSFAPSSVQWWQMEFVPMNGVIEYRGAGDDQDRVSINAGQVITLDFNAGTATIK